MKYKLEYRGIGKYAVKDTAGNYLTNKGKIWYLDTYIDNDKDEIKNVRKVYDIVKRHKKICDMCVYRATKKDNLWPRVLACLLVLETKTDIAGKYKIENIKRGDYFLYALYETSFSLIEWLVPVEDSHSKNISLDLYNDNAIRIVNKD